MYPLTFINYPVEQEQKLDFYVENVVSETSVYVPLRIYIIVENGITVKINYSNDHTDDRVKTLLHRYIEILENGIEKKTLKELKFKD